MTATHNGNPCVTCGSTERYKSGQCAPCNRERTRIYRAANRELIRERDSRYRHDNRAKEIARHRKYQEENKDKIAKSGRKYRRNNKQKRRDTTRKYREANREKLRLYNKAWATENKDLVNAYTHCYRTRKTEAGGSYTPAEWRALCSKYGNRCVACGEMSKLTADHVIPVAHGGHSDISNIQPLCDYCNKSKWTSHTDYR